MTAASDDEMDVTLSHTEPLETLSSLSEPESKTRPSRKCSRPARKKEAFEKPLLEEVSSQQE